jgi:beta-galactosidase
MSGKISRRQFHALLAGTTLGGKSLQDSAFSEPAPVLSTSMNHSVFPFGTHVYREPHLPLEQLRHDLPILKRLGFTMIKIQEVWANDEQREGEIDLSNVSQVVSEARQNGLRVYFGITMETAPAWLWRKFPDANLVYETGQPENDPTQYVLPADGKPGPCWNHPGARAAAIRFIEAVGREIGKYDNIEVWNVWQEIGFWPMRPGHLGFCFCHNTLLEFRTWLRAKYGSLQNLNGTWKSAYGDWEEIEPPRFSPQVPPTLDWRYFMDDVYLASVLKWKGEALRRTDPFDRPILAHVSEPTYGGAREWQFATVLDVLGSSCYPAWTEFSPWDADHPEPGKPIPRFTGVEHELWEGIMMRFDYLRSAKPDGEIWTAELQSGPIIEGLNLHGRDPDPDDIRRWVLGSLAAGARGICFWNHRPEIFWQEGYGFGLLNWGSDSSPRADEAGRLSRAINAHRDLFSRGQPFQPEVAVLVSEDLYHFLEADPSKALQHYVYTIRGIYKCLWSEGIPVAFMDSGQLANEVGKYKAIIAPFPVAMSQGVIGALRGYVKAGGTLISEACPGRFSNFGMTSIGSYMAPGVAELFGVRQKQLGLIREPDDGAKWTGVATSYGDTLEYRQLEGREDFSPYKVTPAYYLQTFVPLKATPILTYGREIAGCVNSYGAGKAYLIGTLLGHGELAYRDPSNRTFLAVILGRVGIKPDKVGQLNRRRRTFRNQAAWFLFNITNEPVEESVPLAGFKTARDLLGEDFPTALGSIQVRVEPAGIRCLILES